MIELLTNFLIELLIPLSFILTILLAIHGVLINKLGAKIAYLAWFSVPLGLLIYCLPLNLFEGFNVANNQIERFIILPTQTIQHEVNINWLMLFWVMTSGGMLVFWLYSHLQFQRKLSLKPTNIPALNIALPKQLTIHKSTHAYSPMLVGLFKQKLIIPENFTALYNQEQQSLILEHEICHFDRNDIYWNLLAFSVLALFWFHPLVWLAYFRFRRDQELSCDQTVLARKQLNSKINYGKALLVAAETAPPIAFAQLSFKKYGDKDIMFERIKHIRINTTVSKFSLVIGTLLSVTLLSGLSYAGNLTEKTAKKSAYELSPIIRIEPKYPISAATDGIEGYTVLQFDIKENGNVENVRVIKSIPEGTFDKSAKRALLQWKYNAQGKTHKDILVQLNYNMDSNSPLKKTKGIEQITVNN
ncbi:MAG: M56 family metallopeptidase [Alteromonadaceae bacterium]|nr:M56 family metallopeptidase [Alteromonadaceae bacterium]